MTIIEAAVRVLKNAGRPLSAQEVYTEICKENLYSFGAKDPLSIVRSELRRHSVGFAGKTKAPDPKVREDSQKGYTPL